MVHDYTHVRTLTSNKVKRCATLHLVKNIQPVRHDMFAAGTQKGSIIEVSLHGLWLSEYSISIVQWQKNLFHHQENSRSNHLLWKLWMNLTFHTTVGFRNWTHTSEKPTVCMGRTGSRARLNWPSKETLQPFEQWLWLEIFYWPLWTWNKFSKLIRSKREITWFTNKGTGSLQK